MQLILFVELCSEMSSRMIFWPNKSICTLIWIPSKYTQMSVNPNHYLEPCLNSFLGPNSLFNQSNNDSIKNMTLSIEETPILDLIPLNPIKRLTHF